MQELIIRNLSLHQHMLNILKYVVQNLQFNAQISLLQLRRLLYVFLRKLLPLKCSLTFNKNMKNMLVQSIKKLKHQKQMSDKDKKQKINRQENERTHKNINSPRRNAPSYDFHHRQAKSRDKSIFAGYSFCFPVIDKQISPKQAELLSQSIQIEGGNVCTFKHKPIKQQINFLLISPMVKPEVIHELVSGKINYKEMLDYHFVTDSLKDGQLKNFQKYSLYVNIQEVWSGEQNKKPSKKIKRQSDNDTEKLSQDEEKEVRFYDKKEEIQQKCMKKEEEHQFDGRREQMEQIMLTHQNISENKFSINKFIAEELTKLMKIYQTERDIGRKIAYMKAAAVIRSLDKEIQTERDVENIKGIGKKISDKIKELLTTGKMGKLQTLQKSEKNIVLGQFCKIWGIGPSKAQELYSIGIKSIEQLRNRRDLSSLLSRNQITGLKYHEQFQTKIPREKVTKMFEFVRLILSKMVDSIDQYRIEVCGSYRRQKATCGDMDIIISRKDGVLEKNLLQNLVHELQSTGFLTDHLTHPKFTDGRHSMSYMGVCKFQSETHHRIDIKYYPIEEYAFAILYFTGSGMFNRMVRLHCMKLGLNLSDHGLTPKMQKGVIWTKPIPIFYTEQDIFKFLGLDYKTPKQRQM